MRAGDDRHVPQESSDCLRVLAPQNRDQRAATLGEPLHGGIGDLFPAPTSVTTWLAGAHCQNAIKQHHATQVPGREVPGGGWLHSQIRVKFRVDVLQTPREWLHIWRYGKGKADGVAGRGVGVLAHDEHPDVWKGELKGAKDDFISGQPRSTCCYFGA